MSRGESEHGRAWEMQRFDLFIGFWTGVAAAVFTYEFLIPSFL